MSRAYYSLNSVASTVLSNWTRRDLCCFLPSTAPASSFPLIMSVEVTSFLLGFALVLLPRGLGYTGRRSSNMDFFKCCVVSLRSWFSFPKPAKLNFIRVQIPAAHPLSLRPLGRQSSIPDNRCETISHRLFQTLQHLFLQRLYLRN